jgi:flavodoxin
MHGNSEKISKQLAEGLKESYDVNVGNIKNFRLGDITKNDPYGLIIAVRIIALSSDKEMRTFLIRLDEAIKKPISKVAYFSTHALGWKKFFIRGIKKTLKKVGCVEEICPEYLEVKMQKAEGPAEEGSDAKIREYITTLKEFLK